MGAPSRTPWQRFHALVDYSDPEGCWPWAGKLNADGYGKFWLEGRNVGAHRFAAAGFRMPPPHLVAAHHCDNPSCVNRDHLYLTTHAGNMLDLAQKGRRKGKGGRPGERHNMARLTWPQVREIRQRYAEGGVTIYSLAPEFGIKPQMVSRIIRNERWVEL